MNWSSTEDNGRDDDAPSAEQQQQQPPAVPAARDPYDPWGPPPSETPRPSQPDSHSGAHRTTPSHDRPDASRGYSAPPGAFDELSGPSKPPRSASPPLESTQEWSQPRPPEAEPRVPYQSDRHQSDSYFPVPPPAHSPTEQSVSGSHDYSSGGYPPIDHSAPSDAPARIPDQAEPPADEPVPQETEIKADPPASKPAHPPTHGRRVRWAIYGVGGLITVALIIAIILMLGTPPPDNLPGGQESTENESSDSDSNALINPEGDVNWETYENLAGTAGSAEWLEWRFGPAADGGTGADDTSISEPDTSTVDSNGLERIYQYGDAAEMANWRNVQGQLAYVPDDGDLSGVDHVTTVEVASDLLGFTPRPGGRWSDEGTPELELEQGSTAECLEDIDRGLGRPVDMARASGSEINAHSVTVFSSGVLATAGISGAQGGTCLALPEGNVPTAVAVTSNNEFALVTAWNSDQESATLAIVALGDQAGSYSSSWPEQYPGLPNPGHFGVAKLLSVQELPLATPTTISAFTDSSASLTDGRSGDADGPAQEHSEAVATAGYAIIGSQPEHEAAVVDLSPLLSHVSEGYFSDDVDVGMDDDQWPETFDDDHEQAPIVASELEFDDEVSSLTAGDDQAAIATRDGTVHLVDMSDLDSLTAAGSVEVGDNPTCVEWGQQSDELLVTSRGTGSVQWIDDGEVVRELFDERITDPLCATEAARVDALDYVGNVPTVLIADFEGRGLHSYRFDDATLANGADVPLEGDFEFGGTYEVTGKPFNVSLAMDIDQLEA